MLVVPFVLLAAAIAILAGVVATAMGRGGELTLFHRDVPAQRVQLRSAADVARLRLPTGLFGYQEQATSDVLHSIADLLARQEAEIASLRDEVWRLGAPIRTSSLPAESGSVSVGTGSVPVEAGGAADRDRAPDQPQPPL